MRGALFEVSQVASSALGKLGFFSVIADLTTFVSTGAALQSRGKAPSSIFMLLYSMLSSGLESFTRDVPGADSSDIIDVGVEAGRLSVGIIFIR